MEAKAIRVVLADDHAVVRKGIREFLEEGKGIVVVAEASNGAEALHWVEQERPDVVVMDIRMPGVTGVEATRRIKGQFPEVKVLVLTAYDNDPYIFALLQAGADGYILKTADAEDLVRAVHTVHSSRHSDLVGQAGRTPARAHSAGGVLARFWARLPLDKPPEPCYHERGSTGTSRREEKPWTA
ncbi:MAG: response regulator [Anaerolineae bacterium]